MPTFRTIRLVAAIGAIVASSGCNTPAQQARQAESMNQLGDAINDVRVQMANMETTLDSMRVVIAKQDTTIAKLANLAGVTVTK
jgi:hypothetical protein